VARNLTRRQSRFPMQPITGSVKTGPTNYPSPAHTDYATWHGEQVPTPVSGERVNMPPEGSSYNKAPKPMTAVEQGRVITARQGRTDWEASPEGQARTTDISAHMKATHGITATPGQIYDDLRRAGHPLGQHNVGPTHYDVQLPGMADPNAAPRPPKWEELSPEQREHTNRHLAMRGTSLEQMATDLGAQHDQAIIRAAGQGGQDLGTGGNLTPTPHPYASDFYSVGEPRQVMEKSAKEIGMPMTVYAQMNAFTSPNTKFSATLKSGETVYPNEMAAKHSVLHARQGGDPAELRTSTEARELRKTGTAEPWDTRKAQGYPANMEKTAQATYQFEAGIAPADWKTGEGAGPMGDRMRRNPKDELVPAGNSPWRNSPKTGPYANSWSDSHPQYFVSDVHSGGGGAVPHLGIAKGSGDTKDKSEREKAIESVPYFHAAADFAGRKAMAQRGLRSTRDFQAGQWGEEQIQRREDADRRGASPGNLPTEAEAYKTAEPTMDVHTGTEINFKDGKTERGKAVAKRHVLHQDQFDFG